MTQNNDVPVTETELKAKAIAPRVTPEQIEARIIDESYFVAQDGVDGAIQAGTYEGRELSTHYEKIHTSLRLLTFCVLVLDNGFTITGQSACADPENFDPEIGRRLARANAVNQMWSLLGFELRTKLKLLETATPASHPENQKTYYGSKIVHAQPMTRGKYNDLRGWAVPEDEDALDEGYLVEYADGGMPNALGYRGYVSWSPKDVFERAYAELA